MPAYDVRPALAVDADRLGAVHVQVWREAYAAIMPADFLAGLDPVAGAARWRELVQDSTRSVLVGTADGEVVGFAFAGPSRDDPPVPEFELYAINVLAAHHGTGLAASLFETALSPADGGAVSLWVATENSRALAFYARYGFGPDGRTSTHDGTGITEVRLVRPAR